MGSNSRDMTTHNLGPNQASETDKGMDLELSVGFGNMVDSVVSKIGLTVFSPFFSHP